MRINNTVSYTKISANLQQAGIKSDTDLREKYLSTDRQVNFGIKLPQYKRKNGIRVPNRNLDRITAAKNAKDILISNIKKSKSPFTNDMVLYLQKFEYNEEILCYYRREIQRRLDKKLNR